jgi:hypothetical protein
MPERPTGTVTFLFTDIEGSTQLWERHAAWMATAHARHEAILREAIAQHGGWAYKQIGDAFQAAFQTAPAALAAEGAAQQALAAEPWGEPEPLRVRMALHRGTAEERADGRALGPGIGQGGRSPARKPADLTERLPAGFRARPRTTGFAPRRRHRGAALDTGRAQWGSHGPPAGAAPATALK